MKHSLKQGSKRSSINTGLLLIAAIVLNSLATLARTLPTANSQSDAQLDAATRSAVIEGALKNLNDAYVFPEAARKMEQAIRERVARKEYEAITSPQLLAAKLTEHLREVSRDKHLRVVYNREILPVEKEPGKEDRERARALAKSRNFGFQKVEQLDGNVGYIDLRGFMNAEWAAETAAEAMNAVANTDALIFDVRNNGGGQPEMVRLLCSYLFDKRTHINDIYWRPTDKTTEYWTLDTVAGKKYGQQREVYVLTSRRTFSAAEEFTYNLKNLKRAAIVGETTGGGAHPVDFRRINDHFGIGVPAGRAINPITKTNWEGTGVKPDVEVPADQALRVAHLAALKNIIAKNTEPARRQILNHSISSLQKAMGEPKDSAAAPQTPPQAGKAHSSPSSEEVKLPDTPAGKTLTAFLQAFNTGNLEAMKKFHTEHGGNEGNADKDLGFYNQSGGLKLHHVKGSNEYAIEVLAQAKKDGRWLNFSIEVEANAPHGIASIRIQPASAPTGNEAKSAPPAGDAVKLPDTPAGKTLAAFLQSFNTGDLQTMKRFHTQRGDTDENAQKDLEFYNQSGGLKIHSVIRSSDYEITALVQKKRDGGWLNFTIQTQASAPHAVDTIDVQPASPPSLEKSAANTNPANVNIAATPAAPARRLTEAEALKEIEAFLDQQAAEDKLSGVVLLARDGKPILKKTYGLADKSAKAPNKADTKFNLGSMNKMFTAVAAAQLAEKGKLAFADKVGKFLPDYPNKDVREKVTIHQLLTHTSGLGSYWNKRFEERKSSIRTVTDYLALFADEPLLFEPGARFEYSNSGFIVLGAIIEKASGQSYYDYVREHIYKPAGMTSSDAYEMTEKTPNLAMGYAGSGGESGRKENTDSRPNRGGPAGGGYSTVEDLLKFSLALRQHKLLSAGYTELVTTGKVKMGDNLYAYGFGDRKVNGKRSFGHNGGAPGIASSLSIFPELGYTVIVMTNYDPPNMMPVVRKLEQMITNL
jgi:CubicO group peptidase (beta-lactamase class C family)